MTSKNYCEYHVNEWSMSSHCLVAKGVMVQRSDHLWCVSTARLLCRFIFQFLFQYYAERLHWDQFQWSFRCNVTMKIIDISVKLGTVPICIIIGIGIGSVETVLHIIILAI